MSKRRRTSSVASRGIDDDDDSQHTSEPSRKKKKVDPIEVIQQLYDTIRNHKKDDGSLLCDFFIRAPKRRQEPAYYEVVANPIDLLKVQQKLKTDEYEDVDDFISDIELLVSNTKAFYKRTSQEYKDACELWDLVQTTKSKLEDPKPPEDETKGKPLLKAKKSEAKKVVVVEDTDDTSEGSVTYDEELNNCEDLFTAVMTGTSEDGRLLNTVFQLLPSKKRYPKYYEVIDNPIDLRMIARKIQQAKYNSIVEMEKDLIQMTKNATTFNEPGSQIYKDAKALRKLVQAKKIEIEQGKFQSPNKTSERIRHKRLRSGQSLSAITAALKSEEEEMGAGDDDEDGSVVDVEEPDNPCWQLYSSVKSATNPQGQVLCEAFLKLPSKRYYPDYFKEIRNPISLAQISKKLQKGQYGTVSEVAGDMNIMFENAKKYNRPDSKLYKDAVKLQKIMQKRVQELLEFDHQYSASEDDSVDEPPQKKTKTSNSGNSTPTSTPVPQQAVHSTNKLLTKGKYLDNIPLKKRLYSLCKCLMQHICEDGRQPMLMFMEKPSKKLYPEYYKVIERPIDMLTIESNIKAELYQSEGEILADFRLMFQNCRKFNEEGSMIYEDAIKLEKILMDKVKELGPLNDAKSQKTPKSTNILPKPKKNCRSSCDKVRPCDI